MNNRLFFASSTHDLARSLPEGRQGAVQELSAGPEAQRGCGVAAGRGDRVSDSGSWFTPG